jgi:hypothetical protein
MTQRVRVIRSERSFQGIVTAVIRKARAYIVDGDIWVPSDLLCDALKEGDHVQGRCIHHKSGRNNWQATEVHATPCKGALEQWATHVDAYIARNGGTCQTSGIVGLWGLASAALRSTMDYRQALAQAQFPIRSTTVYARSAPRVALATKPSRTRPRDASPIHSAPVRSVARPGGRDASPSRLLQPPAKKPRAPPSVPPSVPPASGAATRDVGKAEHNRREARAARFGPVEVQPTAAAMPPSAAAASAALHAAIAAPNRAPAAPPWTPRAPPVQLAAFACDFAPDGTRQMRYVDELTSNEVDVVLALGATGAGKTLFAMQEGLRMLRDPESRFTKIVLLRPDRSVADRAAALQSDEADEAELMKLHQRTTLKAIDKVAGDGVWLQLHASGQLEIEHWREVRGDTFDADAWVVVDEAQHATLRQIQNVCTRHGGGKIVLTGDDSQFDLSTANRVNCGLRLLEQKCQEPRTMGSCASTPNTRGATGPRPTSVRASTRWCGSTSQNRMQPAPP